MKRLIALVLFTVATVTCHSLTNSKFQVLIIDMTPKKFGDFYNPFMRTLNNSRFGNQVQVVSSWSAYYERARSGDVWVLLNAKLNSEGSLYEMVYGSHDECGNPVYRGNSYGFAGGDEIAQVLKGMGYEYANLLIEYIGDNHK